MQTAFLKWAILGLGPSLAITFFGLRGLIRQSSSARLAYIACATWLSWIMPALAVLATIPLTSATNLSPILITLLASGQLLIYYFMMFIFHLSMWLSERQPNSLRAKDYIAWFCHFLLSPIATIIFLLIQTAASGHLFNKYPDISLFLYMMFASYVVSGIPRHTGYSSCKTLRLAPCELYFKVMELAKQTGRKVTEIRIISGMPFRFANAMAYAGQGVMLSEDLVNNLTKDEVDAVIAHEIGHIADENMWNIGTLLGLVAILSWLGISAMLTKLIAGLPGSLQFLHYINWLSLFLVPQLVYRWYSRCRERKAEANIKIIEHPEAAISGVCKLYFLGKYPICSPWWWDILSTHPAPMERFQIFARLHNLSNTDIENITARVESEIDQQPSDRYEIVCCKETEADMIKRPNKRWQHTAIILGSIIGGAVALVAGLLAGSRLHNGDYFGAGAIIGLLACAAVIIVPIVAYQRVSTRSLRRSLNAKLQNAYPDAPHDQMLLVDAIYFGDYDKRTCQGSLMGIIDNQLALLGESAELRIPIESVTNVTRWADPRSNCSSAICVVVSYLLDGMQQWVILLNIGRAPKSEPRNILQLEKYTKKLLIGAGAQISKKKRKPLPIRNIALRLPVAIIILLVILALVEIVCRAAGLRDFEFWPHFCAVATAAPALWAWVMCRATTKVDRPDKTP